MKRSFRRRRDFILPLLAVPAMALLIGCQTTGELTYRQYQAMTPDSQEQVIREVLARYLEAPELENYDSCVYAYFDKDLSAAARKNYPYIGIGLVNGFMEKEDPRFRGNAKLQIDRGLEVIAQTFCRKPGDPFRS